MDRSFWLLLMLALPPVGQPITTTSFSVDNTKTLVILSRNISTTLISKYDPSSATTIVLRDTTVITQSAAKFVQDTAIPTTGNTETTMDPNVITESYTETSMDPNAPTETYTDTAVFSNTTTEGYTETTMDSTVTTDRYTETTVNPNATTEGYTETTMDANVTTESYTESTMDPNATTEGYTGTTMVLNTTTEGYSETTINPNATTESFTETTMDPNATTESHTGTTTVYTVTTEVYTETTMDSTVTTEGSTETTTDPNATTEVYTETTVNPNATTEVYTETTMDPNATTESHTGTTMVYTATTEGYTETTVNPNATTEGYTETTVNPNATTEVYTETTVNPNATTEGCTETTMHLHPTTVNSTLTTMGHNQSTLSTFSSTTSTTTPPPTTTVIDLNCENGGTKSNGVCICPDEWTGVTCSIANVCNATELSGFSFPPTVIGWFAYSTEKCPDDSSAAGKPKALTRCSIMDGYPSFSTPQVFQCDQTLNDIQQNLTNVEDLETLAASTQILTSRPEDLTSDNVTTAAQITNTLLLSPNATENVRVAAIATISQLLETDDSKEDDSATQSLTQTLDQLAASISLNVNTSQSQVVQPNLVVQSANINTADSQGVQFTSFKGTSGSFVADRIRLNTNTSQVVFEDGFISEALIYIRFPSGMSDKALQDQSNISLGFVLYQNDRFFPSKLYRKSSATIRVLSGSIGGQLRNKVSPHVEILFKPAEINGTSLHDFSCVYWNYTLQDWSNHGCSKGGASDGVLKCFCNHTTNFAALWSFRENYDYAEALDIISIVGLSFSILGLIVTIIHHFYENFYRKMREQQSQLNSKLALLSIYISLLAFILTFLSGVQNKNPQNSTEVELSSDNQILDSDTYVEPDTGSCTAVAALLHFFLLATFAWNSVYGTQLMLLVRSMRRDLPPHWTQMSLGIGWGGPAVVMAITLAVTYRADNPLGYRQEEFCWLSGVDKHKHFNFGKPMFWAFLLPIGLILIYNMILLVLTSITTCKVDPTLTSTKRSSVTKKFLVSFSLAVMLGLSWTLGYLVLVTDGHLNYVLSILFCVCTTTQGFQIFILFTARTPSFRASMQRSMQYVSSVSNPLRQTTYNLWRSAKGTFSETYREFGETSI